MVKLRYLMIKIKTFKNKVWLDNVFFQDDKFLLHGHILRNK